jgi:hypothetical protein
MHISSSQNLFSTAALQGSDEAYSGACAENLRIYTSRVI